MERPSFFDIKSGNEFNNWYWLKTELVDICKSLGIPHSGRKFDLRDRIICAIDGEEEIKPIKTTRKKSSFNWAKEVLTPDTIITDNVSFGPNFRNFMKVHIGNTFSCHSDFMGWVRVNEGKTLHDAIEIWFELESRKEDPNFKREIAEHNMFNKYTRDFLQDNEGMSFESARKFWLLKKKLPAKNGFVIYESSDLLLT